LEFVCQREELLRGISIVERAATSKESMQILEGIYIRAEGDHLHLAATDLELSIECDVPATVVQQGEAVLGSKVLSPIVRKLVGDQLVYRTSESGLAQIESGPSHFTVHTMVADEFPALPEVESTGLWRISQGELRRLIRHTAFAAATTTRALSSPASLSKWNKTKSAWSRPTPAAWLSAGANSSRRQTGPGRVSYRCGPFRS